MNKTAINAVLALMIGAAGSVTATAADGEKVFRKCKACHAVDNTKNKVGPHLVGVVGRKAGAIEGYKYSKAMANSGVTWDDAALDAFLAKPKAFMKGTKMAFPGLKKSADRTALIEYLKTKNQ